MYGCFYNAYVNLFYDHININRNVYVHDLYLYQYILRLDPLRQAQIKKRQTLSTGPLVTRPNRNNPTAPTSNRWVDVGVRCVCETFIFFETAVFAGTEGEAGPPLTVFGGSSGKRDVPGKEVFLPTFDITPLPEPC